MKKSLPLRAIYVLLPVVLLFSCNNIGNKPAALLSAPTRSYPAEKLERYFLLMCTISKSTPGFYGPQTARAYGYLGITGYESVVHGIQGAKSLAGQINGLEKLPQPNSKLEYNWAISANTALAQMMRYMFVSSEINKANADSINNLEKNNLKVLSAQTGKEVIVRSVQFGKAIAETIYQASETDGGNKAYLTSFQLPYTPAKSTGSWMPADNQTKAVAPYWGKNRPFLSANINQAGAKQPVAFSADKNSLFYKGAIQVYNQVKHNTADQVAVMKFWSDDPFNTCTPTGHMFNIMVQLLKENHATLEKSAVALAKLSIAENDGFINSWKIKFNYNRIRPEPYIRKYIDPQFTASLNAGAYPSFIGGHACEAGAGSVILGAMFTNGNGEYHFTDYSQLQYGFPAREYHNFNSMATECANSRLYAGIHYPDDNSEGLRIGRIIGNNVNQLISWPSNPR